MSRDERREAAGPAKRKRTPLTLAEVVAAGSRLLDEEGVGGLSMRAVARRLGVGHGSLYWQVRDKDELLRLILDDTLRDIDVPAEGPWDERLTRLLVAARLALRARPELIPVLWKAGWDLGGETLRVADLFLELIAESGLPEDEVSHAYWTALVFVLGFVMAETSASTTRRYAERPDDAAERYPHLVRFAPGTEPELMDTRFHFGLEELITSMRARAAHQDQHTDQNH
ncbi:TetR/AcrR family transcriptional regulator [Spirillospora sp. NPDC048819]|uniref:TetR/AcrR family transcriptional regulator n=1 Tax=Spirillospora sp. NPDC048819 TaxID=3155268 RepID=UPI0033F272B6